MKRAYVVKLLREQDVEVSEALTLRMGPDRVGHISTDVCLEYNITDVSPRVLADILDLRKYLLEQGVPVRDQPPLAEVYKGLADKALELQALASEAMFAELRNIRAHSTRNPPADIIE